jgi:hypothetical protein
MDQENKNSEELARELEAREQNFSESNVNVDSMEQSINQNGLGSINMDKFRQNTAQNYDYHMGWIQSTIEDLPSMGLFYPKDVILKIRSAKVAEIRHFSTIDENNYIDMEDTLNYIIESCVILESKTKKLSYKDICEEDRIVLLLKVRDLTFPEPENQIILKGRTGDGKSHDVELSIQNLVPSKIPEEIAKYYDDEKRLFEIRTKSAGNIEMKPPTIGIMQEVTKYLKDRQEKGSDFDKAFLQVLPYIASDWRSLNPKKIFDMEVNYKAWSERKFMIVYRLAEKMKIGVSTTLEKVIDEEIVKAPLEFPGGIKSLFIISDLSGELL